MKSITDRVENVIDKIIKIYIDKLSIEEKQEAVLRYSLHLLISTVIGYALALIAAYILNIFTYTLVIMLTISILRTFSGGAHCFNMINCGLYSMIIINVLGVIAKFTNPSKEMIIVIFLYSLWAINKYAPADTPGKPINSKMKIIKLRKTSFLIICLWYMSFIGVYYTTGGKVFEFAYISGIGILWQSFSVTKIGYKFFNIFDMILNRIFLRGEDSHV